MDEDDYVNEAELTNDWLRDAAPPEETLCHCGKPVAAIADPFVYANPYMVDLFCGNCITVRCDAYPGACRPTEWILGCRNCDFLTDNVTDWDAHEAPGHVLHCD